MTVLELRTIHGRLTLPEKIEDAIELIDIYCNFYLKEINIHKTQQVLTAEEMEANIIFQMMMTKALHLKNIIKGINFTSKDGIELGTIIDPTIVGMVVRNAYETAGMFNLIFRVNQPGDERTIAYNLWVHSGLRHRQKFIKNLTVQENIIKSEEEKASIDNIKNKIQNTQLFLNLSDDHKELINSCFKRKDYLVYFEGNKPINTNWSELYKPMDMKQEFFENIYTHFSFSTHPSNVSVFQFREMFQADSNKFIDTSLLALQFFFISSSIFIADYIHFKPKAKEVFASLPLIDQILINFHNTFGRSYDYSINETWKALG